MDAYTLYSPYVLRVRFSEPRDGWWNGGCKTGGSFVCESLHPGVGHYVKWGCFELNFWFTAKAGRSWREAAAAAKRRLEHLLCVPAVVTVEHKESEGN